VPLWFRVLRIWLPVAVALTAACGLTCLAVQQNYRNGLDDPQVQLAQDGATRLDAGFAPSAVVSSPTVDAETNLAPFVIVLGKSDEVLASGVTLGGATPTPPAGVLATARSAGRNRVTWQPRSGVRIASVSVAAKDGRVVLAGRNMREVEARIDQLTGITGLVWAIALVAVLGVVFALEVVGARLRRNESNPS
jgi:hypothetical protein